MTAAINCYVVPAHGSKLLQQLNDGTDRRTASAVQQSITMSCPPAGPTAANLQHAAAAAEVVVGGVAEWLAAFVA